MKSLILAMILLSLFPINAYAIFEGRLKLPLIKNDIQERKISSIFQKNGINILGKEKRAIFLTGCNFHKKTNEIGILVVQFVEEKKNNATYFFSNEKDKETFLFMHHEEMSDEFFLREEASCIKEYCLLGVIDGSQTRCLINESGNLMVGVNND